MGEGILKQNEDGTFSSQVKEQGDILMIRLNEQEAKMLKEAKRILEQPKESTCLKQLAEIGFLAIHEPFVKVLLQRVFENKRKNKRLGIVEYEV